jgi:hypothetical protein
MHTSMFLENSAGEHPKKIGQRSWMSSPKHKLFRGYAALLLRTSTQLRKHGEKVQTVIILPNREPLKELIVTSVCRG